MSRREFLVAGAVVALGAGLGLTGCAGRDGRREGGRAAPAHHIRYAFTIENPGSSPLAGQVLWFYAPLRRSSGQLLERLAVSVPAEEQADRAGNTVMRVALPVLAPYAALVVAVEAELALRNEPQVEMLGNAAEFLEPEPFIQSDDPAIRTLAAQLKKSSPVETARAIYDWVQGNLRYAGYVADDLGAARALQERRGDCTEYAYLACALARACGLPARAMGGYVVRQNTVLRAEDYHNWAELYLDGRWRVVDAQKGAFLPEQNHYAAFEVIASRHGNGLQGAHRYRMEGSARVAMGST